MSRTDRKFTDADRAWLANKPLQTADEFAFFVDRGINQINKLMKSGFLPVDRDVLPGGRPLIVVELAMANIKADAIERAERLQKQAVRQ